jgi:hypothetical protein
MQELLYSNLKNKTIGIEGFPGCGKSTGMIRFVKNYYSILGNCLMIFPNQYILDKNNFIKLNYLKLYTARKGLAYLIKNIFNLNTIIIDESHYNSIEYDIFIKTLAYFNKFNDLRIYFISSTLDRGYIEQYFPDLKIIFCNIKRFDLEINYVNMMGYNINPSYQMNNSVMEKVFIKVKDIYPFIHNRIIVFLATHDQCEKYRKYFSNFIQNCAVLYGNLNDSELLYTENLLYNLNLPFVLFTTNISETGITIPNVSLIIDLCICYRIVDNKLTLDWCDKSSLIQRAGRAGRTCNGKVLRLISHEFFQNLIYNFRSNYNYEKSVLELKYYNLNPISILGQDCMESYLSLKNLNILDDERNFFDRLFVNFCIDINLEIKPALLLWKLIKTQENLNTTENLLIILSIVLINLLETQNVSFIYKSGNSNFHQSLKNINTHFKDDDELCLLLSIFVTLFLNKDSVSLARYLNLNFKTFRIWFNNYNSCLNQIMKYENLFWKKVFKNNLTYVKNKYYRVFMKFIIKYNVS